MGFIEVPVKGLINLDHVESVLLKPRKQPHQRPELTFCFTGGGSMDVRFEDRTERDKVIEVILTGGRFLEDVEVLKEGEDYVSVD